MSAGRASRAAAALALVALLGCTGTMRRTAPRDTAASAGGVVTESRWLRDLLRRDPALREVSRQARRHRLQVVVGTIEERTGGRPALVQQGFRAGAEYVYPASTVKLLAAIAALEFLDDVRRATGLPIDADTPLRIHPLFDGEEVQEADPTHVANGKITVRHELRKLFLVSDNEAFNRLYALLGQDRLHASMERAGLRGARIVHRLSQPRTAAENRRLPRIDFVGDGFTYTLPARETAPLSPLQAPPGLRLGRAFLDGEGRRVDEPFDFAPKNRVPLAELQRALCMLARPDADCGGPGFALSTADRELLLGIMGELPRESRDPVYDPAEYSDSYVKFALPGLRRVVPAEHLRLHDKTGQAYGFTLENGWVVDVRDGRSFFLAAALYTNADGVLNDDQYEYATVAEPFLADLGAAVARHLWHAGE